MSEMNEAGFQDYSSTAQKNEMWGANQWDGSGFYAESDGRKSRGAGGWIFDGLALPDTFLEQYYSQVSKQQNTMF